jgi:hypothetical protein
MTTCYIYGLRAKDSTELFYVGSTKFLPDDRLKAHLYEVEAGTHKNRHFANKVRKIGLKNVVVDILEEVTEVERWHKEQERIANLVACGVKLTNRIHNGVNFEISDAVHEYDNYVLTKEKFLLGVKLSQKPPPMAERKENQGILDAMHGILRDTLDHMLKKYPKEVEELLNGPDS